MPPFEFHHRSHLDVPADAAFRWHMRPGAFERLTPPWENVRLVRRDPVLAEGARAVLAVKVGPLRRTWVAEHRDFEPGRAFTDVQIEGPFRRWSHRHRLLPDGADACWLEDHIEYELPGGPLARLARPLVEMRLTRTFDYRHRITRSDLAAHGTRKEIQPMRVLVTGSHGFVGSTLLPFLTAGGHDVVRLVRGEASPGKGEVRFDIDRGEVDLAALEGADAVVHLAGDNIAEGRWTAAKKQRIRDSRIRGTRLLAESLARLARPPRTLISASAVGYYGDRGDERLDESRPPGTGFLAEVCRDWEAATAPAAEKGIRVVLLRFGVILAAGGGALAKMLPPFKLGAGGRIGDGKQWVSWIAIDDVLAAILAAITNPALAGPVNVVSPNPVTNAELTRILAATLHRPAVMPVPAFAARLAFGEMADAALLASARVEPAKLAAAGFKHAYPELEGALRHLLGA